MSAAGFACLIALTLVPAARADTIAPPGNSAVQEYLETVPIAGGGKIAEGAPEGRHALSKADRARLQVAGRDGQAVAQLAEATAPSASQLRADRGSTSGRSGRHAGADGSKASSTATPAASSNDGTTVAAVAAKALSGDGGIGPLLPAILIAVALLAAGVALLRRRSTGR